MAKIERTLKIDELADELDLSVSTLSRYKTEGMPFAKGKNKRDGDRFNQDECAAWMKANGYSGDVGAPATEVSEEIKKQQLRKLTAQADKYEMELKVARLAYDREVGEVVAKADVERRNISQIQLVKNGLLGLSASLGPQLEGLGAVEIQERIDAEVRRLLEQFSKAR